MKVLWLQSGGCGGCSMSLLNADTTDFPALLADAGIEWLWHPSISLACGGELLALLDDVLARRVPLDVLAVEGALLRGPHGTGRFHMLAGTGAVARAWPPSSLREKAAASMVLPPDSASARAISLRSSRMLPGQG